MERIKFCLLLFAFLVQLFVKAQDQHKTFFLGGNICQTESWKLVFHDEFSGSSLDTSKWYTYYPYGSNNSDQCEYCRTHGDEGQIYLDQNVEVSNGTLKLIARNDSASWFAARRSFTSGMIHSKINNFKYGKYEIRCKILSGIGFWPAFWTFGGKNEIDVFEFGTDNKREFYSDVHNWNWNGEHIHDSKTITLEGTDFSTNFHTYAIEWDYFYLRWFVDGVLVRTVPKFFTLNLNPIFACNIAPGAYIVNPLFPTDAASIIANLAIGGPFTRMPDSSTVFPNQFEIDYIRVYQRKPQAGFTDICQNQNSISGVDQICDNQIYVYHFSGPSGSVNSWSVSPNLRIIASDSISITVQPIPDSNGQAWIRAAFTPTPPCPQSEVIRIIGIGKPLLYIYEDSDGCNLFLRADIQSSNNNLVGSWTIVRGDSITTSTSLFEIVAGSSQSNVYYYYTYTVSNECGTSEVSGTGIIPECDDLIQFTLSPNPANETVQVHIQRSIFSK